MGRKLCFSTPSWKYGRQKHVSPGALAARAWICAIAAVVTAILCKGPWTSQVSECLVSLQGIHRYAVKSCTGEGLQRADLWSGGLVGDRSFAVCRSGRTLTQRECPRLAAIFAELLAEDPAGHSSLRLSAPSIPDLLPLDLPESSVGETAAAGSLFGARIEGMDMGNAASAWLKDATG
ncbi:unnamed protein product, partial [Polarella glacialis]